MISPYSSSSTAPEVSSKSLIAGGADADSGTSKISPAPSTSPLSSIPIKMLVLLALCMTRRGRLKLLSRPETRITPFRDSADKEERQEGKFEAKNLERKVPWILGHSLMKTSDCGYGCAVY
jgi:hypothetical protein